MVFINMKNSIGVAALGLYLPKENQEIISKENSKINVHIANYEDTTYEMGKKALMNALENLNECKTDLKYWIHCNDSPGDYLFQLVGRKILDRVNVGRCNTYNIYQSSNCSLLAIKLLIDHLRNDEKAFLGGISTSNHWQYHSEDRTVGDAVLGDGAATLLLKKGVEQYTFDSFAIKTIGEYHDIAAIKIGGYLQPLNERVIQEGGFKYTLINEDKYLQLKKETHKIACEVADEALLKAGITKKEIQLVVLHSQTPGVSRSFIQEYGLNPSIVIETVNEIGYMCSGGILFSLSKAIYNYKPSKGSKILVISIGIDGNWCATIMTV
ncbi:hypothetical protein COE15_25345 [Bacillus cereus]|nr:hypothetical protein CN288_18020 [Bacillus sp. AFS023182]PGX91134.1 hypothetical protein COE15_25345 [Bacillus cereus]